MKEKTFLDLLPTELRISLITEQVTMSFIKTHQNFEKPQKPERKGAERKGSFTFALFSANSRTAMYTIGNFF